MDYFKLLETLYGSNLDDIIIILNRSEYSTDYTSPDENIPVMHTGFSFSSHKETELNVLFDWQSNTIIIQPKSRSFPKLLGLLLMRQNSKYYNGFLAKFPLAGNSSIKNPSLLKHDEPMNSICLINDEDKSERTINSIEIEDDEKIKIFPLQKHLTEKIFIRGNKFKGFKRNKYSLYKPDIFDTDRKYDRDRYENYSDNDAFYDATDGQLGDLGYEGWTYLGRD